MLGFKRSLTNLKKSKIVAEFGFVLEGDDESVLPENILGSIRLQSSDFDGKFRLVDNA